ncbi:hypothetical protein DFH09DRAFT_1371379 [Mycena vulgaris]|nr:hypothetical protein DFH09DRAFT_1371379 [Mycena vulgaris]
MVNRTCAINQIADLAENWKTDSHRPRPATPPTPPASIIEVDIDHRQHVDSDAATVALARTHPALDALRMRLPRVLSPPRPLDDSPLCISAVQPLSRAQTGA